MSGREMSKGSREEMVVTPMRQSCRKVLYFEMVVGLTSAEGFEKSQKRLKVFCAHFSLRSLKEPRLTGGSNVR
jgi:hypothetical protein